ncbi:MAG TPA: hypothetical protein VJ654_02900 [Noviherbaspirillum sp.]|nr:hypothetical protein [Noviherbaspirillum sp.]
MKKQNGFTSIEGIIVLFYLIVIIGGGYGWIANIVKLFNADFTRITGALVLRCIGIVAAPLGAVMGYL